MITLAHRALGKLHDRLATATARMMSRRPKPASAMNGAMRAIETMSHGDFTAWNVFLLGRGSERRLAVIDYEDVGTRPHWWDAARLVVTLWTERRLDTRDLPAAAATLGTTRHKMLQYIDMELRSAPSAVEALTIPLSATRERLAAMRW
jgi:Ser/Thr protein kinase RdoA (MazF antagonist)